MFCLSTKPSPKRSWSNTTSCRTVLVLSTRRCQALQRASLRQHKPEGSREKTGSCFSLRLPPLQTLHHSTLGIEGLPLGLHLTKRAGKSRVTEPSHTHNSNEGQLILTEQLCETLPGCLPDSGHLTPTWHLAEGAGTHTSSTTSEDHHLPAQQEQRLAEERQLKTGKIKEQPVGCTKRRWR